MDSQLSQIVHDLTASQLAKILKSPEKTAITAHLIYTNDKDSDGISRKGKGKNFEYFLDGEKIQDESELARIKALVIPPAWENVWICRLENGHLQATGIDTKKRKQYRYHELWNQMRKYTKFYRMLDFGRSLPKMRAQIHKDLTLKNLEKRKVLAIIVSLMERTNIRIGNVAYEKLYDTFGLTTLQDEHLQVNGDEMRFTFVGKKGIFHDITLKNKKLARVVQNCKEIPGHELFQYYDESGHRKSINSGMVNEYLKEISGSDFSAKDFRTWHGSVNALITCDEIGPPKSEKERKFNIKKVYETVAQHLGNTPSVCKKYYVHPFVTRLYEKDGLQKYFNGIDVEKLHHEDTESKFLDEEKILLRILENEKIE